jgi:hypothetical protein
VSGQASITGRGYGPTAQAPHVARAGLAQALLNGSCLGPARQTRTIWPSISLLYLKHQFQRSYYVIFLQKSPYISSKSTQHKMLKSGAGGRHQPRHRLAQWLLHVHGDVSHHARTIVFAIVGRPVHLPGLRLVLPPQPAAPAHGRSREPTDARRRGYDVSRSCSWPFSVRAVKEDMVVPAMLRLSWR